MIRDVCVYIDILQAAQTAVEESFTTHNAPAVEKSESASPADTDPTKVDASTDAIAVDHRAGKRRKVGAVPATKTDNRP